jgi:hypothetical protein
MPDSPNDLFTTELTPPREALPPSFWEAHQAKVLAGAGVWLLVVAVLVYLLTRTRSTVPFSLSVRARRELEALRKRPPDAAAATAAARIVRSFLLSQLELHHEPTTTELSAMLRSRSEIAPALAGQAIEFLQRCDTVKFGPGGVADEDLVAQGIQVVERFESLGRPAGAPVKS